MELQTLTAFFMWCTIINGGLLVLWTAFCMFAPDLVYRTQTTFFPLPRETFNVLIYAFDSSEPAKQQIASSRIDDAVRETTKLDDHEGRQT